VYSPLLLQARSELPQGVDHPQPGLHGALRIIFVRQGVAEVDEQAIPEILLIPSDFVVGEKLV
jgi:hypothetical protein